MSTRFSEHLTPPATAQSTTLAKLKLSTGAAARLLGVNDRTVRRFGLATRRVPPPAERFSRYLARAKVSPQNVMEVLAPK